VNWETTGNWDQKKKEPGQAATVGGPGRTPSPDLTSLRETSLRHSMQ